jgi:hypothetical protein
MASLKWETRVASDRIRSLGQHTHENQWNLQTVANRKCRLLMEYSSITHVAAMNDSKSPRFADDLT